MKIKKPWMTAILSAAVLFSGAVALTPKAFADDDSPIVSRVKAPFDGQRFIANKLSSIVMDTATIADKDYTEVQDSLYAGQTLIQASGLGGSVLAGRLQGFINQDLSLALQNYTATEEQLTKLKSDLYSAIQKAISTPGYHSSSVKESFNYNALLNLHIKQLEAATAAISKEDYIDIKERLLQGSSLAKAALLNESSLTESLLSPIAQEIDKAVQTNLLTVDEGSKLKDQARGTLFAAVSASGGAAAVNNAKFDTAAFLKAHVESIAAAAYLVTHNEDLDYSDLQKAYAAGASLTHITGVSADELASRISKLWEHDLNAVDSSWTAQDQNYFQQQAIQAIKTAVTTAGK
jgi:hypothetical protein